jgi:hypothetical protein
LVRQISTNSLVRTTSPDRGFYLGTTFFRDGELIYYTAAFEKNKFEPVFRIPVLVQFDESS